MHKMTFQFAAIRTYPADNQFDYYRLKAEHLTENVPNNDAYCPNFPEHWNVLAIKVASQQADFGAETYRFILRYEFEFAKALDRETVGKDVEQQLYTALAPVSLIEIEPPYLDLPLAHCA